MTIETVLNAPGLRGVIPSPRACMEWWAYSPADPNEDGKRRLLVRAYSNHSVDMRCMLKTPLPDLLALLDLTVNDLRGTDGKLPPMDPGWWRTLRRYDSRNLVRPQSEQ